MKSFNSTKYKKIKLLITKDQKQWLADNQVKTGVKPTEFIRQIVKEVINNYKQSNE